MKSCGQHGATFSPDSISPGSAEKQSSWVKRSRPHRQCHVSALVPGFLRGSKSHCESPSGNSFSSELIRFSFHRLIKRTSKMMRVLLGPFPMAAKHLPSAAPPPPRRIVSLIVVEVGYLEVSRLTGCLDFLKLCLSLNVANRIVYTPLSEPGARAPSCTQCCYFCCSAPFPREAGISAFCGGSVRSIKPRKEAGWRHS